MYMVAVVVSVAAVRRFCVCEDVPPLVAIKVA